MSEEKRNDAPSSTGADKDKSAASASKPNKTTGTSSTPASSASGTASAPATDTSKTDNAAKSSAASGGGKPKTGQDKTGGSSASKPSGKAQSKGDAKPASKPADKPAATNAGKSTASSAASKPGASSGATATTAGSASHAASGGSTGTPHRATPAASGNGGNGGGASKIIAIVAVVIAIIALIISGWLYSRGQDRLASLDSRLNTVENGMESNVQDVVMPRLKRFESQLESVSNDAQQQAESVSSLQESVQQTQTQMADVADKVQGSNNRWDLNQIESLLRAANQRLQLHDDPQGARKALELASDAIRRKNDPRLFDLRGEIANEIAALEALPDPDVEGMSLALVAMIEQVPQLPLASNVPGEFKSGDGSSSSEADSGQDSEADSGMSMDEFQAKFSQGWDHFTDSVGEALSGMLTIRRSDGTQRALLPPEQAFFLNQNLQLELRTARLALLERDTENYRESLANARQWLEDYYDTSAAPVSNMRERIGQMSNVKLDWDAPDISASLVELRETMSQRAERANGGSSNAQGSGDNTSAGEAAAQDGQ
ncbi:hypothetical protein SADO_11504 [Salinisphaera dokdonensis CL-ES53]|uniref:Uroporphyrin-3 C-methyltransferase n=1 Tax=Salinisphaera dokdonensis CL-ES53 TaxID=1304272 RepID=A0ABV2B1X1_9GAMM